MIEFDPKIPIYIQIMNYIKRDIITGKLKEGEKLPSVREMADQLKVNPNTMQRVYQELERENVTFTQRGMGTFITGDKTKITELRGEMAREVMVAFVNGMKSLGFSGNEIVNTVNKYIKGSEH